MPEPIHTLGINAAFHDSAACLVRDGIVIAAAEDERFTHVKHANARYRSRPGSCPTMRSTTVSRRPASRSRTSTTSRIRTTRGSSRPRHGRAVADLAAFAVGPRAAQRRASPWHPLFLSSIVNAPRQLAGGAPHHLQRRFRGVTHDGPFRWHFVEHHLAHEASAFLAAPFALRGDDDGRARRACDDELRRVRRPVVPAARPGQPAAFARVAVRTRDALPRLPALVRRVQGDGARVVRQAGVRRRDAQAGALRRRRTLRDPRRRSRCDVRPAARTRRPIEPHHSRHRACVAARAGRNGVAGGRLAGRRHRRAAARDGGRRRAELRDEREDPRSRPVRRRVGAARRR